MKLLVVYYTQTGQIKSILDSVLGPLSEKPDIEIDWEELQPDPPFPFPWPSDEFFQVFPESVAGIPCRLKPVTNDRTGYDLIVLGWQPWYLSPSLPFHAFLQSEAALDILGNKPVISITGCRNMWAMALEDIKCYLDRYHARLIGNVVLRDKAPNLLSVLSIIRWLIRGEKKGNRFFPDAGVSEADIESAGKFGNTILNCLLKKDWNNLYNELLEINSIEIIPDILFMEKNAKRIFVKWARFILKKGPYGSRSRLFRIRLFKYYLIAVIYLVSPFVTAFFYLTVPFRKNSRHRII